MAAAQERTAADRPRAAIYIRVSTDKQERGASLDEQERACRELADREGYEVVELYKDVLSGARADRPAYQRMLQAAPTTHFEALIIWALDRFGRDLVETNLSLKLLDTAKVKVLPVRGHIDRDTPEGQMMTNIEAAFAEFERQKIKIRTRMGIANYPQNTGKPWGRPGYGYRRCADGQWEPKPDEVAVVKLMFARRIDGLSYNAIAVGLNRDGARARHGGRWHATQVRNVLESKRVLGFFQHGGKWHRGKHPAIVDEDAWNAVQAIAGKDAKFAPSRAGRRPARHIFFGGALRCAYCGEKMYCLSGPTPERDSYACSTNRTQHAGTCEQVWHRRVDVDGRFLQHFEQAWLDVRGTTERYAAKLGEQVELVRIELDRAETDLANVERKLARVERDYEAEELGAAAYTRIHDRLQEERSAAEEQVTQLQGHLAAVEDALGAQDAEEEVLRRLVRIRQTVAADDEDRDGLLALRGAIAQLRVMVWVDRDGAFHGGRYYENGDEPERTALAIEPNNRGQTIGNGARRTL